MPITDRPPAVSSRFPAAAGRRWRPLGAAGGFSGAAVWRGDPADGGPAVALKAWPPGYPTDRLAGAHLRMVRARQRDGLEFVPVVFPTRTGETVAEADGRAWDVVEWRPGHPDPDPPPARLQAAMSALAALHRAWRPPLPEGTECPAAVRRAAALSRYLAARPTPAVADPGLAAAAAEASAVLAGRAAAALELVRPWAAARVPVQPCLRDVWHAHVLFVGDRVSGVVDYGAVGPDSPAADLARLLADYVGPDPERVSAAVAAYRGAGGPDVPDRLVFALLVAGLAGSAAGWLERLIAGPPVEVSAAAAAERLGRLTARLAAARTGPVW